MLSCGACSDTLMKTGWAQQIFAMHLGFGWDGAGYHAIITRDGICHAGRRNIGKVHIKGRNAIVWAYAISRHEHHKQFAALELCCWTGQTAIRRQSGWPRYSKPIKPVPILMQEPGGHVITLWHKKRNGDDRNRANLPHTARRKPAPLPRKQKR